MRLFWHQRDLRLPDNRGLAAAAADGPVLPVYVVDENVLAAVGDRRTAFVAACLRALREAYREWGSDLLVRTGAAEEVLPALAAEHGADAVVHNEHYGPGRRDRRERVAAALRNDGVDLRGHADLTLVDPADLDAEYGSHSRFLDDWRATDKPGPAPEPEPTALAAADAADPGPIPEYGTDADLPPAGYAGARERYDRFLADGIGTYADTRDDLARAVAAPDLAVSRMSPYLAAGAVGVRELWADATDAYRAATGERERNVGKYRYELTWREQNYALLYHFPALRTENYKSFPDPIAWRNDAGQFEAWKRGRTGYPLVDAGMRQLEREGYVHNRPRQVVASFLTKHLLIDWRWGERHFADRLLDFDPANNAAMWQWTASTGTDSVDVRIFDPVAQMSKYDDGADFVTEYVPELRGVDPGKLVDWPTLPDEERAALAPEYPDPVVDRNRAYERAQRVFEEALGKR